ncbi:hypothetical protein BU23DRAFT_64265 [Bimuria novae-zelandiae CBS 107.79]|uniref:Uncharacterized protein n=1 Tax=Bimuria novae-zelandiae CBS 107.79 TaxID=1447943 RepID=A0A6A5UKN9_9PLEO|nr:hypothetical protein BU23DRAFT_64265 [Bimuria novae-zelandiae CBS 107.79]
MPTPTILSNETWLAQSNWTNGSLTGEVLQHATDRPPGYSSEWLPVGHILHSVNLTVLADNFANIQRSTAQHQDFGAIFALARMVLSQDYYSRQIACIDAISGTYDWLVRVLFYIILLISLFLRRHSWIAFAALATAMVYAATTAVHTLALLTQFGWCLLTEYSTDGQGYGDPGLQATTPILIASLLLMTRPQLVYKGPERPSSNHPSALGLIASYCPNTSLCIYLRGVSAVELQYWNCAPPLSFVCSSGRRCLKYHDGRIQRGIP